MIKRILKVLGVLVAALLVAAGSVATYASRTWDNGRYATYPLPELSAGTDSAIIARGRYLAFGPAHCVDCHTPPGGATLSGGVRFAIPLGDVYSPNITPDSTTGIARYTDGQIARMLRYNVRPHGRAAAPFMQFERMSDDDVVAILSYLRSNAPALAAMGMGPASISIFMIGSTRTLRPSSDRDPRSTRSPGSPKTRSSVA
ncbi:MAG: c-type cytochrome [Gemmatimonadaceae bacterium]